MPQRIQRQRTKDECLSGCGSDASPGQRGYCTPACRFWSKVIRTDGCWYWTGARHNGKGYGRFDANRQRWLAHRYAFTLLVGPIPQGFEIDHRCQNTRCVNPGHLDPVTPEEHAERTEQGAYNRAKTTCPQDHAYSPENTRLDGSGRRHCRTCERNRYAPSSSAA